MSGTNRKTKLSVLLMASLISANLVCMADAYKNNVVDVKVNKESGNSVKVTIYTDKPYTEPVVVNKKANNKYVILMPETKSVLKSAPTITNGAGTVSDVSVNTQAVSGGKGYTKIIITSEKAINVVPRTQQMTGVKVVDTPSSTVTKLNTNKPVTAAVKPTQTTTQEKKPTTTAKTVQKPKQEIQKPVSKPVVKPVQKEQPVSVAKTVPVQKQVKQEPINILENEIKTGKNANFAESGSDVILEKEIQENLSKNNMQKRKQVVNNDSEKKSVMTNIRTLLRNFQYIGLWKLLLLAGAITFPVIVIMLILAMDKKITKKIDLSFKQEAELDPILAETSEKCQTEEPQETYNSFDEMLNKVEEPATTFHEEQLHKSEYEKFVQSAGEPVVEDSKEEFKNDFEDSDFENNVNPVTESCESDTNEETDRTEYVQQEGLPAVPGKVKEAEPYDPDGYLADFSQVEDSDFFDELVMQTMADNNKGGLPEQSPADEIFNFMSDDVSQNAEPVANDNNVPVNNAAVTQPIITTNNPEDVSVAQVNTVKENNTVAEEINDNETYEEDDGLTMLTEAKIDDNKGMYLVNYDNFSSLVGHIKDDYFVIKKFDDVVNSRIILKQTEKIKDITRYLVRVGKNKMVVEVSETSMSRLLDL